MTFWRAAALRSDRNKALGWTMFARLCESLLAMRRSAERFAIDTMRQKLSDEDSTRLAEEMNQHSLLIRRAVIELVAQIASGARELTIRVEGGPSAKHRG